MSNFWDKAQQTAASAHTLLSIGDGSGAVNRAYFAMFHAARSTLERVQPELSASKRHATIIGKFALHVVRQRGLDPIHGRAFNLAFDQRMIADYEGEPINPEVAREIVEDMDRFLVGVQPFNAGRGT